MATPEDEAGGKSDGRTDGGAPERATAPQLQFPCDYPIKVMARAEAGVRSHLDAIVERYAGPLDLSRVVERPSAQKNFVGVTYVIRAKGPEHIATLFDALKLCPQVLLVL
jgi:putative lipoic acid-binding regulatory protein